jgi:YbbR domain-containing protein
MKQKRLHIIFTTVFFAVLLWISVKLGRQYQTTVIATVDIENLPQGSAIKSSIPRSLRLRLRGDGWQLVPVTMGANLRFPIDLKTSPYQNRIITIRDVTERLSIPMGVQVASMTPDSIFVQLDTYAEKRIRVEPDLKLSFRDGYDQIGKAVVAPESVLVGGARSVLDGMHSWRTVPIAQENVRAPIDMDVPLSDTSGIRLDFTPDNVHVNVEVQPLAEKTFAGIPVEVTDVPSTVEVIVIPPKVDLVVRSGVQTLGALVPESLRTTIGFAEVAADTTGVLVPHVQTPEGVQLVSKRPDRVQYVIRQRF